MLIPQVSIFIFNLIPLQELDKLLLKSSFFVMVTLIANVSNNLRLF